MDDIIRMGAGAGSGCVALVDQYHLGGALQFYQKAKAAGLRPIIGSEVRVQGFLSPLTLIVNNSQGYAQLSRILSAQPELGSPVSKDQFQSSHLSGLIAISRDWSWSEVFRNRYFFPALSDQDPALKQAPKGIQPIAYQEIHYGVPEDRWKFDLVQAIRTQTRLKQSAPGKKLKGALHWPSTNELTSRFAGLPLALENTWKLVEMVDFDWQFGELEFPEFEKKPGQHGNDAREFLRFLALEGADRRYGNTEKKPVVLSQLEEELSMIHDVGYESYFIAVWEILQLCRREGIDWITRGSAADSLVCYCLGISNICPIHFGLYFKRFLNKERMALNKLPDIDIDFPHDRKDDVLRLIFDKYGTEHAALVGGFSTFQARGAVGDVGKALGISEFQIRRMTEKFPWGDVQGLKRRLQLSPEAADLPLQEEPYRSALEMALFLDGFPRYPKAHPCGVVISRRPMLDIAPTFMTGIGFPATHFEMDDVESLGLVKLDILAQGGLTALRETRMELVRQNLPVPKDPTEMQPWQDEDVWRMISEGRSRGVHHIESPAMLTLAKMCGIREIHGLVALVSVIRPGAANEGKKQAFARRYQGMEPTVYEHPSLESCLSDAYGMVVFEEHILKICERFAGMDPGKADLLRRALGKAKRDQILELKRQFVDSARRLERPELVIESVWSQVEGFAGYAFCKAHSAAYAVEAYGAAWLKFHHPAEFMAAVLSGGKGFYSPLVYILECYLMGVKFLPPSVQRCHSNFRVENENLIRTPLRWIKGISDTLLERVEIIHRRSSENGVRSLREFFEQTAPSESDVDLLLRSGALDCFSESRVELFWECRELLQSMKDWNTGEVNHAPLLTSFPQTDFQGMPDKVILEEPSIRRRMEWESELLGCVMSTHPLDIYEKVAWNTYCPINTLQKYLGQKVTICGRIVVSRVFHQITGEMMKFLTVADYTGMVEMELFAKVYKKYGLLTTQHKTLEVEGWVTGFENGNGFTLRGLRVSAPRLKNQGNSRHENMI